MMNEKRELCMVRGYKGVRVGGWNFVEDDFMDLIDGKGEKGMNLNGVGIGFFFI